MPTVSGLSRSEASDRAVIAQPTQNTAIWWGLVASVAKPIWNTVSPIWAIYGDTLDAGNVWLLRYDKRRPGGQLKWGRFLKDLALGTGIGLRYDLTFLVIRLDWGIGLHVPYDTGKKGYYNIPDFKDGMGVHLAIGYPF